MKILVTGSTSRQCNPEVSKKDVTIAALITEALRGGGHEVEHRDPDILEDLSDFDHVFVGLGPLHGLGTNRAYGALACVLRTIGDGRLSLYTDDPDFGKVVSGLKTMRDGKWRLTKPFFAYKKQHDIAEQPQYRDWLNSGVDLLADYAWPNLIVPWHSWATQTAEEGFARKVPQAAGRIVGVDFTSWLPDHRSAMDADRPEVEQRWVVEGKPGERWLETQRREFPTSYLARGYERRPCDDKLVDLYRRSWGVLEIPTTPVGYWTSRIGYAAQAQTPYVTRWQDVAPLGECYTVLADRITQMTLSERDELGWEQSQALAQKRTPKQDVTELLESCTKREEVSA